MLTALISLVIQYLPGILAGLGIFAGVLVIYYKGRGDGKAIVKGEIADAEKAQSDKLLDAQAKVQKIEDKRYETIENIRNIAKSPDSVNKLVELLNTFYSKNPGNSNSDPKAK